MPPPPPLLSCPPDPRQVAYSDCRRLLPDPHALPTVTAQRALALSSEGVWRAAMQRLAEREAKRRGQVQYMWCSPSWPPLAAAAAAAGAVTALARAP